MVHFYGTEYRAHTVRLPMNCVRIGPRMVSHWYTLRVWHGRKHGLVYLMSFPQ
jgi:hypothetical protein